MVHTRRLDQSSDRKRKIRAQWKRMKKKTPITRNVQKLLEELVTSSSSSSDASDPEFVTIKKLPSTSTQHGQSFSGRTTRRSLLSNPISNCDRELYTSDSGDIRSSESRIRRETGRLKSTPNNEKFSIPRSNVSKRRSLSDYKSYHSLILAEETPTQINLISSDNSSVEKRNTVVKSENVGRKLFTECKFSRNFQKREMPTRKTRLSLLPTETPTLEVLGIETEANFNNESFNSRYSLDVERKQNSKKFLEKKTSHKRQANKFFESDSSDSEVEKVCKFVSKSISPQRKLPARTIRTLDECRSLDIPKPYLRTQSSNSVESSNLRDRRVPCSSSVQNLENEEKSAAKSSATDQRITRNTSVQEEANEKTLTDFYMKTLSAGNNFPVRNITPQKNSSVGQSGSTDRAVTRSISGQKESREKISNNSQVEITPSKNDFHIQNIVISLPRTSLSPKFFCPKTETIMPIANSSNINQTTNEKETNDNTLKDNLEIEDLLQELEMPNDFEEEINSKRSPVKQERRKVSSKRASQKKKTIVTSKNSLHDEKVLHSGKKNEKSENCDRMCTHYDKYVTNIREHNISKSLCDNAAQCDICKKFFHSLSTLNRHKRMIHEDQVNFKCKTCDKKFPRLDYLKNHERLLHSNNPYFTCKYCDKNFNYKHSRNIHERSHTNEKPFQCSICRAKFVRKDYYKKHRLQHDIKRVKFICDECGKPFADKFSLMIHIQHHMKMKENADNKDYHVEIIQLFINDDWD